MKAQAVNRAVALISTTPVYLRCSTVKRSRRCLRRTSNPQEICEEDGEEEKSEGGGKHHGPRGGSFTVIENATLQHAVSFAPLSLPPPPRCVF